MLNINRSIQPTLGIDISASNVRVLQLSTHKQRYHIDHIGTYPLPENCISERMITDIDSVAECIRKAVLSLEVTPQITPDNRVSMVVSVTNDSIGDIFQGIPSINTNEVTSNVLVNNGQTIVLGGIYTEGSTTSTSKVPFFGDLPIAGKLFRNESKSNNKKELLIFMTPKIIDEQLNMVL